MRERARSLGCKLELASSLGRGTRVQVSVEGQKAYLDGGSGPGWGRRFLGRLIRMWSAAKGDAEQLLTNPHNRGHELHNKTILASINEAAGTAKDP